MNSALNDKMSFDMLDLIATCAKWKLLYQEYIKLSEEDKAITRAAMSHLSSEITRLENKLNIQSRNIQSAITYSINNKTKE